jgi:hypothetical protein
VMVKTGHYQGRERVKRGTYRIEDADIIPAQDVRTLPTGCAWVIARGVAAKVQMGMPPDVPEVPIIIQRGRAALVIAPPAPGQVTQTTRAARTVRGAGDSEQEEPETNDAEKPTGLAQTEQLLVTSEIREVPAATARTFGGGVASDAAEVTNDE